MRLVIENFTRGVGRKNGRISELTNAIRAVDSLAGDLAHETPTALRPKLLINRVRSRAQIEEHHRFMAPCRLVSMRGNGLHWACSQ